MSVSGKAGRGLGRFRRPSFAVVCVVMWLEAIGANMVHPVEPAFYIALGLPDWIFGAAYAAMAFGLFALSPLWGVVSDRVGRVPTLAVTTALYGCSQLAFCVSTTVPAILLSRFAAGAFCSGALVCALAYVADVTEPAKMGRSMSIYGATQVTATALGYTVGGLVGVNDPAHSFVLQFFLLVCTGAAAFLLMEEGPHFQRSDARLTVRTANPLAAFAGTRSLLSPWMVLFLVAELLACTSTSSFDNSFNYYLRDQYGFPTTYNGAIYAVMGVLGFCANIFIGLRLQRGRDPERSVAVVLGLCAIMLGVAASAGSMPVFLVLNMVYYMFNSMYLPLLQALAMKGAGSEHGKVSGLFQSVKSFGMVSGSLIAGFIYELNVHAPFLLSVCVLVGGAAAMLGARHFARTQGRQPVR